MTANKSPDTARRVGRPRANQQSPTGPVREQILSAARTLFRRQGFKATSTRAIAEQAGLKQPSLFHYFKNKDEIFRAVALGAIVPVLEFLDKEAQRPQAVEVALYRLTYFDTLHLCTNENVLGSPFQFPELTREKQPEFWALRDQLIAKYRELLEEGQRAKIFQPFDLAITTQLIFALGESTLTWYRPNPAQMNPTHIAKVAAETALRAVLAQPSRLATLSAAAEKDLR